MLLTRLPSLVRGTYQGDSRCLLTRPTTAQRLRLHSATRRPLARPLTCQPIKQSERSLSKNTNQTSGIQHEADNSDLDLKHPLLSFLFRVPAMELLTGNHQRRKKGNVLFNDAFNTFHLRLYGVRHMVKDHSDSERGNPLPPHGLLFPFSSKGSFICIIP